jgi:hypothetical protein
MGFWAGCPEDLCFLTGVRSADCAGRVHQGPGRAQAQDQVGFKADKRRWAVECFFAWTADSPDIERLVVSVQELLNDAACVNLLRRLSPC